MAIGTQSETSAVTLYRFYDEDDRLLYVGVTSTGLQRVRGHASRSHWWPHVARATFDHGRTLNDEQVAIELERPLFNVEHTDRSDWIDTVFDAVANGYLTEREVIRRHFDSLIRLRDRLDEQVTEVNRRLSLLIEADRTNRRLRRGAGREW